MLVADPSWPAWERTNDTLDFLVLTTLRTLVGAVVIGACDSVGRNADELGGRIWDAFNKPPATTGIFRAHGFLEDLIWQELEGNTIVECGAWVERVSMGVGDDIHNQG